VTLSFLKRLVETDQNCNHLKHDDLAHITGNPVSCQSIRLFTLHRAKYNEILFDSDKSHGDNYLINYSLIKLSVEIGTQKSRDFLQVIEEAGQRNRHIFECTFLQKFIDLKFSLLKPMMIKYLAQYLIYLGTIIIIPFSLG
jgi:hypothetical protein